MTFGARNATLELIILQTCLDPRLKVKRDNVKRDNL